MEEIVRKIVQEELAKALLEIIEPASTKASQENIIYNFEAGNSFGINKLAKDIKGLEHYFMSSYFPHSEMNESWMFEIEKPYGGSQLVEVIHGIDGLYESYWELNVSELEKGSSEPTISASIKPIKGYKEFIEKVNSSLEKIINPDLL
ncbi:MAG: hypothetical protein AABY15_07185 [Nanoarchaeota archaeon]